jgi:excisionase family DNA binding protein
MTKDEQRLETVGDGCLTILEACEFSGLGRSFIYSEMDKGKLPYVKLGKRRLIPRKALQRYLESGLVTPWAD